MFNQKTNKHLLQKSTVKIFIDGDDLVTVDHSSIINSVCKLLRKITTKQTMVNNEVTNKMKKMI